LLGLGLKSERRYVAALIQSGEAMKRLGVVRISGQQRETPSLHQNSPSSVDVPKYAHR
jgi:hypothetical protein